MRARLLVLTAALLAFMAMPFAALADLEAGVAAFEVQDYDEALRQFSDPALARDSEALSYLAWMAYKGLGQPRDLVAAYAYLSLTVMYDPAGPQSELAGGRRVVASELTAEQILQGEQRVIAHLRQAMGEEGLNTAVAEAVQALQACSRQDCVTAAEKVVALGPAAVLAIPQLEVLMTADPLWIPRQTYAYALSSIGTKAVPALCRIGENMEERRREGTWNAMQSAASLAGLGPAAREGRDCLLRIMAGLDKNLPAEEKQVGIDVAGDEYAMLYETERVVAYALVVVGDPERASEAAMQAAYLAEPGGEKGRLMAYVIGMIYGNLGPILEVAPAGLADENPEIRIETLSILTDLAETPGFARGAQPIVPALQAIAEGDDPDEAELAAHILGLIAP